MLFIRYDLNTREQTRHEKRRNRHRNRLDSLGRCNANKRGPKGNDDDGSEIVSSRLLTIKQTNVITINGIQVIEGSLSHHQLLQAVNEN